MNNAAEPIASRSEDIDNLLICFKNCDVDAYNRYFERIFSDSGYFEHRVAELDPVKAELIKAVYSKYISDLDFVRSNFLTDIKQVLFSLRNE